MSLFDFYEYYYGNVTPSMWRLIKLAMVKYLADTGEQR